MEPKGLEPLLDELRPAAADSGARLWLGAFSRDVLGGNLDLFFRQTRAFGKDAGADVIHDMRVTARRLSEYLVLAAPATPAPLSLAGREFLDAFTKILSPIRNCDVPCGFLAETLERDLSAYERDAALELQRRLLKRRGRKLERALDFWSRGQTRNRLADLARLRRGLARAGAVHKSHFPEALAEHLEHRLEKVRRDAPAAMAASLASPAPRDLDHVLHAFRREVRLLRYSADASRGACGRPRPGAIRRLRAVQQALGEHHDLAVLLRRVAQAHGEPSSREPRAAALSRGWERLKTRYQARQAASLRRFRRLIGDSAP